MMTAEHHQFISHFNPDRGIASGRISSIYDLSQDQRGVTIIILWPASVASLVRTGVLQASFQLIGGNLLYAKPLNHAACCSQSVCVQALVL